MNNNHWHVEVGIGRLSDLRHHLYESRMDYGKRREIENDEKRVEDHLYLHLLILASGNTVVSRRRCTTNLRILEDFLDSTMTVFLLFFRVEEIANVDDTDHLARIELRIPSLLVHLKTSYFHAANKIKRTGRRLSVYFLKFIG